MKKKLILTVSLKGEDRVEWKFDFKPEIDVKKPSKDDHYLAHVFEKLSDAMKDL